MKRKIYSELLDWKNTRARKEALMIDGARRVGKSFIVEEFAKNEYRSYLLLDFTNASTKLKNLFRDYLDNLDQFFMHLSLETGITLYEHQSLIIFDEVQKYPQAREAIKYLVADNRYDYIETGSLVSINQNVKNINIPSEEHRINMYPMDLEEFLWALGDELMMPFVRDCYQQKRPLDQSLHRKMMDYLRLYMIVGGMPQAVMAWIETHDFNVVDAAKRNILSLYRGDISKYAKQQAPKVTRIFDTIPAMLQRHEKKVRLSDLAKGARMRNWETAFFWLNESRVINSCYAATEPTVGLGMRLNDSALKVYMADTGLLISHAFSEATIRAEELYRKLMHNKLEINRGMLVENLAAQMLVATGRDLYFFSSYSKTNSEETMEIDFLVAKPIISARHNIHPIEVKSSSRYTTSSLLKFQHKYAEQLAPSFVFHSGNVKEENGIVYLPLYMVPIL